MSRSTGASARSAASIRIWRSRSSPGSRGNCKKRGESDVLAFAPCLGLAWAELSGGSGRPTAGRRPFRWECRHIASNEITDLGQLDVRSRIVGENFSIERIVALLGKYRRHPLAPDLLHCGQDAQLVVDEHVVVGGIEARDVIKLPLFVDVDEDAVLECLPKAGSFHFARLEHGIAVREDDGGPPLLDMLHRVQSAGI